MFQGFSKKNRMPRHPTTLHKLPTDNSPRVNFTPLPVGSDQDDWHSLQRILKFRRLNRSRGSVGAGSYL